MDLLGMHTVIILFSQLQLHSTQLGHAERAMFERDVAHCYSYSKKRKWSKNTASHGIHAGHEYHKQ